MLIRVSITSVETQIKGENVLTHITGRAEVKGLQGGLM